jgi:hypothetical protein
MINSLKELNLPHKLISLIEMSITETFVKIKVGAAEIEPIQVKSGLRQRDSISPILFNLILEKVIKEMNIQPQEGFKLQESDVALLAYADDVVLMSNSHNNLKSLFTRLEEMAKKVGLQVNEDKTEYMVMGRRS